MTEAATKDDIKDIHKKLDTLTETVIIIRTKQELQPPPLIRPCPQLTEHINKHNENLTLLKRPIVSGVIGAFFVAVGILLKGALQWIRQWIITH